MSKLRIPVSNKAGTVHVVEIDGSFPLSAAEWVQLHLILDAMKPGLVTAAPSLLDQHALLTQHDPHPQQD